MVVPGRHHVKGVLSAGLGCSAFEAMQGFHVGVRKSGIGGADGKHGLYEFTQAHVVCMQRG